MKNVFFLLFFSFLGVIYPQDKVEFYDPTQLKRGMKGYALTVIQGLEPEKMGVEVISYIPNYLPKAGLVLVKLEGKNVERTRVAAGMSGSPVYIDNKLVGALAYTWANARELTAGIVPIQDMISDKSRSKNLSFNVSHEAIPIQTAWSLNGVVGDQLLQKLQTITPSNSYPFGIEEFTTVPSSRSNGIAPLKGGDAVAIKLVEGDISIASIGTVTYVDGEDVYIYGHPLDGEGPISLPLARAEIFDIMPSTRLSFKIGQPLPETIGSTMFDGLSTVYGRFDKKATMIPVSFTVGGKNLTNSYKMKFARSRKYLPTLMGEVIGQILERELGKNIEKQLTLSWNIELTNNITISNEVTWVKHTVYSPNSLEEYWKSYIDILWNNSLSHFVPKEIKFKLSILEKPFNYYNVTDVKTSRNHYVVGETIEIPLNLNQYMNNNFYTNINLKIPSNITTGTYSLLVGSELFIEKELVRSFPENYKIRTAKQIVDELSKSINTHALQAVLVDVRTGSILANKFFKPLPKSKRSLFKSSMPEKPYLYAPSLIEQKIFLDNPVLGGDHLYINIENPTPIN